MWNMLLIVCAFFITSAQASPTDYSDIWYSPSESGWGVNLEQNGSFIFATFFVYGTNGTPTWYTAQLTLNPGNGSFNGPVYATTGPYYGAATFDPTQVIVSQVGSATFRPAGVFGQISYNIGNVIVTKNIQRQVLTTIPLAGTYRGAVTGTITQCNNQTQNSAYGHFVDLAVTQSSPTEAAFTFNIEGGTSCAIEGSLERFGALTRITNASYVCAGGLSTTTALYEVKVTSQGIEGSWAGDLGSGCFETAHFSAVSK